MNTEDVVNLGGNIQLSGFKELDGGSMVIVRKIVGSYARKLADRLPGFEQISIHLKPIHQTTDQPKLFELHAKVVNEGKTTTSETSDRNLFVAIDTVLKKLEEELFKQ